MRGDTSTACSIRRLVKEGDGDSKDSNNDCCHGSIEGPPRIPNVRFLTSFAGTLSFSEPPKAELPLLFGHRTRKDEFTSVAIAIHFEFGAPLVFKLRRAHSSYRYKDCPAPSSCLASVAPDGPCDAWAARRLS